MEYLILIYGNEKGWMNLTPEQGEAMYAEYRAYGAELAKAGVIRGGNELMPTHTAKTVREQNGKFVTTDGPFAETREQLGGYFLIETDSLESALTWAAKCPGAKGGGCVEVRQTAPGMPQPATA